MEQTFKFYPISNWVKTEEKGSVFRSLRRASEMELYNFFKENTTAIIEISSGGWYDTNPRIVIHNNSSNYPRIWGIALFASMEAAKEYFEYLEKIQFFADISCKD